MATNTTTETISIEVTRSDDGTINVNETLYNAENLLMGRVQYERLQGESLSKYVHAVFDENKGKKITMPVLQASVLQKISQEDREEGLKVMQNYNEWTKSLGVFVRSSSEFDISKGKGGGAFRVCDAPPKKDK